MAAILDWRLPEPTPTARGPLPWLPGIPPTLHGHPVWGAYLAKRSQLVADLANQVQHHARQSGRHDDRRRSYQEGERRPSGPAAPGR